MAGDQPIAEVRTPHRTGPAVRAQALAVAVLASLPLTVSGHYLANILTGDTAQSPCTASFLWLLAFSFLGVLLVLAAVSNLLPGWERAGRGSIVGVSAGVVMATIDYWQLVGSPSGLALNVAGLGIVVASLQAIYWTPRSPLTTITLRASERIQEWFASMLVLGGVLSFALPHTATIDGASEDCAPLWIVVERDCLTEGAVWWQFSAAAIDVGATMLAVIHHDPIGARATNSGVMLGLRKGRRALEIRDREPPRRQPWF